MVAGHLGRGGVVITCLPPGARSFHHIVLVVLRAPRAPCAPGHDCRAGSFRNVVSGISKKVREGRPSVPAVYR